MLETSYHAPKGLCRLDSGRPSGRTGLCREGVGLPNRFGCKTPLSVWGGRGAAVTCVDNVEKGSKGYLPWIRKREC